MLKPITPDSTQVQGGTMCRCGVVGIVGRLALQQANLLLSQEPGRQRPFHQGRIAGDEIDLTAAPPVQSVREIERRIQRASVETRSDVTLPPAPAGIPYSYEDHIRLMYDLLVLAFQANITRVITFMVAREISNRTYPQVGVPDGHHAISHHQNRPDKMDKNVKIQTYHLALFSQFVEKMRSTRDGDASLLDHSVLLYGSNMSDSHAHDHFPLPLVLVGGGCGTLRGGRHLRYPDRTPHSNLLVTMLQRARVPVDALGDSTGECAGV